jgi:Flp pilus assembly protein TadD
MQQKLQTLVTQAEAALKQGDYSQAEKCSRAALELSSSDFGANLLLGSVLFRTKRKAEAIPHFRVVAELDPTRFSAQFALGRLLLELGRPSEARQPLERAVVLQPDDAQAQHNLAAAVHALGHFECALGYYQRAVELNPQSAEFHNDLGVIQIHLGQAEAADASHRRAFKLSPGRGKLAYYMANQHHFQPGDPELDVMVEQHQSAGNDTAKRVYLAFALGKAYGDLGDTEKSFAFYQEGNRRYRETFEFSVDAERGRLGRIQDYFGTGTPLPAAVADCGGRRPVFIMGMPRSGTTLVEQILASHSRVRAIGESDFVGGFVRAKATATGLSFPELLASTEAGELRALGELYLDKYAGDLGAGDYLVEKTTLNFYYLGLLKQIFPHARFIHCLRDPIDTCWSIFTRYFVQGGHHYGYDLKELGQYYQLHIEFVGFWRQCYGESIHKVDYAALVEDPEREVRTLLDFCGLDFDPACLAPHETSRGVRTASAAQVRQPIRKSKTRACEPYLSYLKPLRDSLPDPVAGEEG